jgi:hypothetical protein
MNAVLKSRARTVNDVLGEITQGAQRVSIATRSWPAFLPRLAHLDEVASTLSDLQRAVSELRTHIEAERTT